MDKSKLTLKKLFDYEVITEQGKYLNQSAGVFTKEEISRLPEPVQRYLDYCGYLGKEKSSTLRLIFEDVNFKMGVDKPWIRIKYQQYNFAPEPARVVYIYSKMFGLMPFEGRDSYLDGRGNMIGRLLKKFTLFNVTGKEIDVSAAVTFLAEVLILPSCALQSYVRWEEIDAYHAKAVLQYNGVKAEGVFTFNDKGEFIRFETEERYMDKGNGTSEKHKWTAAASDYVERNGIRIPSRVKGIWNLPSGDFEYFDGRLAGVE